MSGTATPTIDFTDERLDNGLRLLMCEDHLAPVAAVNLWYDVGSKHEEKGKTGLAHLFEHMMFQGSTNVAKGEHFKYVEAAGGGLNASTWLHRTNYFESGPSNNLELFLWLEADRMGGLLDALGQETLDNQRDVVKNEKRQRYDDAPYGSWWLKLIDLLFPEGHPYHHPTIGSMEDLSAASVQDCHDFFRTYYAPNNAVLSVVGDIDPAQTREWVKRYFGGIEPNAQIPAAPDPSIGFGLGEPVRLEVPDRVPLSKIFVGYRSYPAGTRQADALEMASVILSRSGSTTDRLYERLVRTQIAQDADSFTQEFAGVSVAGGSASARPETPIEDLEQRFHAIFEGAGAEPIDDDELGRARAGVERMIIEQHFVRASSRADFLSENATVFGDPARANERLTGLLDVNADEIRAAAREVFRPDNRVTLVYVPGEKKE